MSEWRVETVEDCLVRLTLPTTGKLQARDYRASGSYPIVDQSQALIAGWTNDERGLISTDLPVVVFGDHTRVLKYIDFPFVRGADGTQVLKTNSRVDPLFFYYACKAIALPSRGYNRHFAALKEKEISIPPAEQQSDIAMVLKRLEDARSLQDKELKILDSLKLATMRALFTRGLRDERQRDSKIGCLPESWVVRPLGAQSSVISGGTPSRSNPAYWNGGTIPWVKTAEVDYSVIRDTHEHITEAGLDGSAAKLLSAGTVLLAMYGQGVTRGKVAILGIEAACNQACAAITTEHEILDSRYLYHFLASRYEAIRQLAHGGQQQNLNLDIVRDIPIAFPPDLDQQHEIVDVLDAVDRKIDFHQSKRAALDGLFKSLLHGFMTCGVLVTDLDLSSLAPKPTRLASG
jgi:type I restriction enzyme S subunit